MFKIAVFLILFTGYIVYSTVIYTRGTRDTTTVRTEDQARVTNGKHLFEKHNCISCHQVYGLGGYLGSDLTTAISDPHRGEQYMKAFLLAGGPRMPNFHFTKEEVEAIISYLRYTDASAITYKKSNRP